MRQDISSVQEDQSDDVGISGAVGVLVVCVSVCWGMSGGVSVLWCGLVGCVRRRLIMRACITSSGGCVLTVQVGVCCDTRQVSTWSHSTTCQLDS